MTRLRPHSWERAALLVCAVLVAGCGQSRVAREQVEAREDGLTYRVDAENPFTGRAMSGFPDSIDGVEPGASWMEHRYAVGILQEITWWHPNGQKARHEARVPESPRWLRREWTGEGQLVLEQSLLDGRPHALTRTWYPDGTPRSEESYRNGALDGTLKRWYANGQQEVERDYQRGFSHGRRLEWFEDGTQRIEGAYANGRAQGPYRRWHANGRPALEAEYHRGQSMEIRMWDEDGKPVPVEPDIQVSGQGR